MSRRNEMPGWMVPVLIIWGCALFMVLLGCAPLTEAERFEREYTRAEVAEEYRTCYYIVTRNGIWVSVNDPRAGTRIKRELTTIEMRRQMGLNNCAYVLREVGYE